MSLSMFYISQRQMQIYSLVFPRYYEALPLLSDMVLLFRRFLCGTLSRLLSLLWSLRCHGSPCRRVAYYQQLDRPRSLYCVSLCNCSLYYLIYLIEKAMIKKFDHLERILPRIRPRPSFRLNAESRRVPCPRRAVSLLNNIARCPVVLSPALKMTQLLSTGRIDLELIFPFDLSLFS